MIRITSVLALLAATVALSPARAGGTPDPDWPCVQRRQPALSVAQVWAGPAPDETAEARARDPQIRHLAAHIALRRTPLPEAEALVADFAASHDTADLTALFVASFNDIQKARNRVMTGITRYAHRQEALDAQINADRAEFNRLMAASPQDFDAIDQLEARIDWSTRTFQDRQQSLTYVCETPVILEQRAFALGRILLARVKN